MRELAVAIIFTAILAFSGLVILAITGSWNQTAALGVGLLWGMMIPVMTWGLKDKKQIGDRLAKLVGVYDPLYGTPTYVKDKMRHYDNRSDLPRFDALLSRTDLIALDVLSISSYVITLVYIEQIKKALDRGVKFNFLILNPNPEPDSDESLRTQSNNYPSGRKLKNQIIESLEALREARKMNEDLEIHLYNSVIDNGILIAHFDGDEKIWMKIEAYKVRSDPNSRSNTAFYKIKNRESKDKKITDEYNFHQRAFDNILKSSKPFNCDQSSESSDIDLA